MRAIRLGRDRHGRPNGPPFGFGVGHPIGDALQSRRPPRHQRLPQPGLAERLGHRDTECPGGIGRPAAPCAAQEAVQTVMHERSIVRGVRRLIQRLQRRQLQDVAGVDRVGIAQPGLDRRDAELPGALVDRRTGRRRLDRRGLTVGQVHGACPGDGRMFRQRMITGRSVAGDGLGTPLAMTRLERSCPPGTYPVASANGPARSGRCRGARDTTAPPSAPNSRPRGSHARPVRPPPPAPAARPASASAGTATVRVRPSAARRSRPSRPARPGRPTAAAPPAGPR